MEDRWPTTAGAANLRGLQRQLQDVAEGQTLGPATGVVLVTLLLAVTVAAAVWFRKRFRLSLSVHPNGTAAAKPLKASRPRSWLDSQKKADSQNQNWITECEQFVEEYEAMEQRCDKFRVETEGLEKQNQNLQSRIATLEATLRKYPQTPMSIPSLTTSCPSTQDTPPTSDATDLHTPKSEEGTTARESVCDPVKESNDAPTPPESRPSPRQPPVPPVSLPLPVEDPEPRLPTLPLPVDLPVTRELDFGATPRQELKESTTTFTPLFDEKVLSTPRTLMELMNSHRLTKESLNTRITKRSQQAETLSEQHTAMSAQLPKELERAESVSNALETLENATSPRSREAALAALVDVHADKLQVLTEDVRARKTEAENNLAYAYRVQTRLDKEMDMNRLESVKHPSGVLLRPTGPPPPVALGPLRLPAQRDLSCLAVNPYKVDSWPIEPNSRGGRASGELAMPPIRDTDEEALQEESDQDSDQDNDQQGWEVWRGGHADDPLAARAAFMGQSPFDDQHEDDEQDDEEEEEEEDEASAEQDDAPSFPDVGAAKIPMGRLPPLALGGK
jgi:hypothetical protein